MAHSAHLEVIYTAHGEISVHVASGHIVLGTMVEYINEEGRLHQDVAIEVLAEVEARKLYIALGKALGVDDLRSTRRWSDSAVSGMAGEMPRKRVRSAVVPSPASPAPVRKSCSF